MNTQIAGFKMFTHIHYHEVIMTSCRGQLSKGQYVPRYRTRSQRRQT